MSVGYSELIFFPRLLHPFFQVTQCSSITQQFCDSFHFRMRRQPCLSSLIFFFHCVAFGAERLFNIVLFVIAEISCNFSRICFAILDLHLDLGSVNPRPTKNAKQICRSINCCVCQLNSLFLKRSRRTSLVSFKAYNLSDLHTYILCWRDAQTKINHAVFNSELFQE